MILTIFVVITLVISLLLLWLKSWKTSPPMFPGYIPLIGHMHLPRADLKNIWNLEKSLMKFSTDNGGVCEFRIVFQSMYVITDFDDGLKVLNNCLDKPYMYGFGKEMFNRGLITADVNTWKIHRKLLNPLFNQKALNVFIDIFNNESRNYVDKLTQKVGKEPFETRCDFVDCTLKVINKTSLGLGDENADVIDRYGKGILELVESFATRFIKFYLHLPIIFKFSTLKKIQDNMIATLRPIMNKIVNNRQEEWETVKSQDDGQFKSILDQLLCVSDENENFTSSDIKNHLDTLIVATFSTTASTLAFILKQIGSNPEVQEILYNEIQEVAGSEDRDITKDDLSKFVYMEAVIKETLRLYPPIPVVGRKSTTDVQLKNFTLSAGSNFMVGLYGINRHPKWGADADQFRPDRWLDRANIPDHPAAFASFGVGRRSCIGKLYAFMFMKIILAHILRRYEIVADSSDMELETDIIMKPVSGHHICVKNRI